jgi:PAS domain S-box-containing protein
LCLIRVPNSIQLITFMNLSADSGLTAYKNNGNAAPVSDETLNGLAKTVNALHKLLDSSLDVICSVDENGRFIYVGAAAERIWGYLPEELTGKLSFDILLPEDLDISIKAVEEIIAGFPKTNFENRYLKKDGSVVPMVWSARWEATDKIMYCIGKDATEKKNAEKKLVQAEEHYRTIFYSNPLPMCIYDYETLVFLEVNDAAIKHYGYSRDEFLSMTVKDLRSGNGNEKPGRSPKDATPELQPVSRHKKKNGDVLQVEITSHDIKYNDKRACLLLLNDITKRLEEESQKEFERLNKEALINSTTDLMWSVDKDMKLITANNSFIETIWKNRGIKLAPGDELLMEEIYPPQLLAFWTEIYQRALSGESLVSELYSPEKKIYRDEWIEIRLNPIQKDQKVIGIACYARNITDQKNYEKNLLDANQKLETAQKIARLGYWEIDMNQHYIYWSNEIYDIWGVTRENFTLSFSNFFDTVHPEDKPGLNAYLDNSLFDGKAFDIEYRIILPDNSIKFVHAFGSMTINESDGSVRYKGAVQDITERRHAAQLLIDSEEKYRNIFNHSPLPKWIFDMHTFEILEVNRVAIIHYGYTQDEFLQKNIRDIHLQQDIELLMMSFENIDRSGPINLGKWRHKKANGEIIHVEVSGHILNYNGREAMMIFSNDLTERLKAENDLNRFFEVCPDLLCISDLTFFRKINPSFYRLLGFTEKELLQQPKTDYIHPDDILTTLSTLNELQNGHLHSSLENRFRTKTGSYRWLSWEIQYIEEEGLFFAAGRDITEKKKAELELVQFKNVIESSRDGIGLLTKNGRLLFLNQAFRDFLGHTPESLQYIGGPLLAYNDKKFAAKIFSNSAAGGYWNGDIQMIDKKGHLVDFFMRTGPILNDKGEVISVYGIHTNISERKELERNLLEYNNRIKTILESITDGFYSVDKNWMVTYWNKEAELLLGIHRELILGKNIWDAFMEAVPLKFYSEFHRAVRLNKAVHFEEYYPPLNKWFEVSAYPSESGLSIYFKEITERKVTEQEMQKRAEELSKSNAELEQFAYIASHDLQEPLRMVTSFLSLLQKKYKDQLDNQAEKYIFYAVDGAKRMREIILDLLEYSRVGKLEHKTEEIDTNELVREVTLLSQTLIRENKAVIVWEYLPVIKASRISIRQVFQNLISNAIIYHKKEEAPMIRISAEELPAYWRFSISDNGIGIDPLFFEKIFVLFQRLHHRDEYSGTGIGLAICKKIIENHKGRIWVDSEPGKGSTFYFTIQKQD